MSKSYRYTVSSPAPARHPALKVAGPLLVLSGVGAGVLGQWSMVLSMGLLVAIAASEVVRRQRMWAESEARLCAMEHDDEDASDAVATTLRIMAPTPFSVVSADGVSVHRSKGDVLDVSRQEVGA